MKSFGLLLLFLSVSCAHKAVVEPPPIDPKWIEGVAAQHNHEVLLCYQDRLREKPKLEGAFAFGAIVAPGGTVTSLHVTKSLDAKFDTCVLGKAGSWQYPWLKDGDDGLEDAYRLYFNAEGQPMSEFKGPKDSKERIRQVVREHLREIRSCYEGVLKTHPVLDGKLVVEWDVDLAGKVTEAHVKKAFNHELDTCIVEGLKTWKFPAIPAPPGIDTRRVTYPFWFSPDKSKQSEK